ncbi:MAG: Superfamily helicase, family [Labilithrix sp.]|nr:Superfamily helicase, family [Labilithrix sp.]
MYSASTFFARLSIHEGKRVGDGLDRWSPLVDWWSRNAKSLLPGVVAMRKALAAHTAEIAKDVETLRHWSPPPPPERLLGTPTGQIYGKLADRYLGLRGEIRIFAAPPGPLEGKRHPGFDFSYDAERAVFTARERRSVLVGEPLALAFSVPLSARGEPHFEETSEEAAGRSDAWKLFALRATIVAIHDGSEDAVLALERELDRPVWDHVLEKLGHVNEGDDPLAVPGIEVETRTRLDWAFTLSNSFRQSEYRLFAFSRRLLTSGRPSKWKKETFEGMYAAADESQTLEREIARVAMCSLLRVGEARLQLGTPQGHELLRVLAQHPRVHVASSARHDPDVDPRAILIVGDLTMKMDPDAAGALSPRFEVDGKTVAAGLLQGGSTTGLRGSASGETIASAYVPRALRAWVDAAQTVGSAMSFPREAVPRLLAATQPLVSAGMIELPRDALGVEVAYEPSAAVRIEWHPAGEAVVELFVSVHPQAPLVAAGKGPKLFTFVAGEERFFVERELARETRIAEEVRDAFEAPLHWEHLHGHTLGLEETLALADYLDRNPLKLPIEVRVGRTPTVTPWGEAKGTLDVERKGSWLVLGGSLDVGGVKITLGEVLDAARLAQRFVRASDGVFLELSKDALERLRPIAIAAELAGTKEGEAPKLNGAFGSVLADAQSLFSESSGLDLTQYIERFEARDRLVEVPPLDNGTLRPYQHEGAQWMLRLANWAPGCILADDMGLGKTVQTAAVLKARAELGPQLIVAPASVSSNWMVELGRFVPSLRARWYNDERELVIGKLAAGDVLVVSYGLLQRRAELFEPHRFATVVVDEAQYVKNASAARTDAVRSLTRDFTVTLTGTPLENHLGELFSIVDLAFPGLLGTEVMFREKFRKQIEGATRDSTRLAVLGKLLGPFLLRRTRATVLAELPPREEITEYVDLDENETKRYLALRRACEQQFAKRKAGETAAQLKIALFAALTRLRQLACDVRLVDPEYQGGSSKIDRCVELCVELAQEGNRALVFSQFTQFLGLVQPALERAGLRVAYLSGETPTAKRAAIVESFQRGEFDVFCVSLLAGGTGLNLTSASYVIHTDPWWNPAAEEQATSRAHRMGQTEPVTVYRLVARGTIEEAVLSMHAQKRELASAVLEGKANTKAISSTELLDLLRFGA